MPSYFNLLAFSLFIFAADALPTSGTSAIPSSSANTIHGDPIPTATGPTCIQTRSPEDPSASDISAAIEKDDSITKACDVASQGTTTLDSGLLPLSVIYYGDKDYFFNSSHAANVVSRPVVSPKLCPNTFHDIFSTCVVNGNFWGGWVVSGGTNRSITNYVYPANPLPHEGSRSSSIGSLGNGPGTQISDTTTKDAGTSHKGNHVPTTTSSSSGESTPSRVKGSSTDSDDTGLPGSSTGVRSSPSKTTIEGASTTTEPSRGTGQHLPGMTTSGKGMTSGKGTTSGRGMTSEKGTTTGKGSDQSADKTTSSSGAQTEKNTGVKTGKEPSETTTGISGSSTSEPDMHASSVPLPPGGTILSATINSQVYSETFIPTTLSKFTTLASTLTTSTIDSESSSVPLVIGPGGVAWVPLHQPSGTNPDLSPPTILPSNPNAPTKSTTTESNSGTQRSSSGSTSKGAPSSRASITAGGPSQTDPPRTTGRGDTTTKDDGGSSTTKKGDNTITNALPIITTSYDPEASKVSSIGPEITGNTAIRTSDDHHSVGIFPFWKGGPKCFLICPLGIDNGGIILWGMDKPGIYPPPTPPPFPNIKWPTITIDDDLKPTATEEPDDEPTSSEDDDDSTTTKTTSKPTSSSVQSSSSSRSSTGTYSTATQNYILAIESVGLDELKQRNSWAAKYYHLGGTSGVSGTATETSSGPKSTKISTTKGPFPSSTEPPSKSTATSDKSSTDAQPSRTINPADCPNDGVRQNAPYCPKPSSVTTFSCGAASNIGAATWTPATWCACQNPNKQYPTMSGDDPCGYTTLPASTISPGPIKPTSIGPLTDCSLVQTTLGGTIAPGPQTYCTCGSIIAGINTESNDGVVYTVCAGDPYPTIASSTLPPKETPKPKPSQAIIIYREDNCGDFDCSSSGHVFEITPGQPVNPCKDDDVFADTYTQSVANDDSDYPVNFGPFKAHDIDGLKYSGSNKDVGTLTGDVPGSPIRCIVPAAQAASCTSSHSIQADDFIPIVYCEW